MTRVMSLGREIEVPPVCFVTGIVHILSVAEAALSSNVGDGRNAA